MLLPQRPVSIGTVRWREALPVVSVTVGGLAVAMTLFLVDPHEPGHYPSCPFLAITGLYCPGCGALRATHDLLHGDVLGAVARNPLTLLALPYLLLGLVAWIMRTSGLPAPRSTSLPASTIWLILGVVLAFTVLRNLPGWIWLSPT